MPQSKQPDLISGLPKSAIPFVAINLAIVYLPSLLFLNQIGMWTPLFPVIFWYDSAALSSSWMALLLFHSFVVLASVKWKSSKVAWMVIPLGLFLWSLLVAFAVAASNSV